VQKVFFPLEINVNDKEHVLESPHTPHVVKHGRHPPIVIYEESIDETPSQQSNKSISNQSNTSSTYRKDQIVWLSNNSTPTNASPTVTPKNSNDNENNKNKTRFSPAQHLRNKLKKQ